jgi:beta-phosphoglucomutase
MKQAKFSSIIFDLDGVLVDTAEFHYQAWKRLADELAIPFDRKKNDRLRGVDRMNSLEILLEDSGRQYENMDELADRKNNYYREMIETLAPDDLLPGVSEFLKTIQHLNIKIGLASSSKNAKAVISYLKIKDLFDAIVDGHDFQKAKPAPDVFLICAERLRARPQDCVVVEDAQAGIDAARTAGMYAIGICDDKRLNGADMLLKNVADIPLSLFRE